MEPFRNSSWNAKFVTAFTLSTYIGSPDKDDSYNAVFSLHKEVKDGVNIYIYFSALALEHYIINIVQL